MRIDWNGYMFAVEDTEFEQDEIKVSVFDRSLGHNYPAFVLILKGLWRRNGEGFGVGDYYQSSMNKETMFKVDKHKSYAALTHDFFIANSKDFPNIRNIFSSDMKGHPDELFGMSEASVRFWKKQIEKRIPQISQVGNRYRLVVNE